MTSPDQVPAWDGQGVDPWLPERLAALAEAVAAEQVIRAQVWSALSEWVVAVRRGVLAAVRPDPIAVYAQAPRWAESVRQITEGPIKDAVGTAYRELLGDGYRFDQRPAVVEHLSDVRNRLTGVSDEVHSLVSSTIAGGASAGESIPEIADRVATVLDTTGTPRWENRATVIARTETLGALNAGRADAFVAVAQELEQPFEQRWLATADHRTRPTHRAADGQRVPVGEPFHVGGSLLRRPGDPLGPGKEVIQCRCTTLLMAPGEEIDLTHRQMVK
jgi:uncharacterized protein with gpF-like domain